MIIYRFVLMLRKIGVSLRLAWNECMDSLRICIKIAKKRFSMALHLYWRDRKGMGTFDAVVKISRADSI